MFYLTHADGLGGPDLLILPGTKSTMSDLLWLRQSGLEAAVQKLAGSGTPVFGVCGGYQMLGRGLQDPTGTEGGGPRPLRGMELLPVDTVFEPRKTRTRVQGVIQSGILSGARVDAYEIHTGQTTVDGMAFCRLDSGQSDGCVSGNICGTYLHGLFDTGEATETLVKALCTRKGIDYYTVSAPLERTVWLNEQYDILAEVVRSTLDMKEVYRILEAGA